MVSRETSPSMSQRYQRIGFVALFPLLCVTFVLVVCPGSKETSPDDQESAIPPPPHRLLLSQERWFGYGLRPQAMNGSPCRRRI